MHARFLLAAAAALRAVWAAPTELTAGRAVVAAAAAAEKLRIMPLGDSITEVTCWRAFVWDMIAEAGLADRVEYVGSQNSNPQGCQPQTAGWDEHHEGHSGWQAIDIADHYLASWLASTPADIVMFMLGTNDVLTGHETGDILAAYSRMVAIMRAANPRMKIIVDLVLPLPQNTGAVAAVNAIIPGWAAGLNSTDSPIVVADCNSAFPDDDLRDGVHPNLAGDHILASRIGPLLLNYIRQSLD